MSSERGTEDREQSDSINRTAESTRFRARSDTLPQDSRRPESYFPPPQSIRLRHGASVRNGLTMRLILPVVVAMLLAFLAIVVIVRDRVFELQMTDLKSDAINISYITGMFGRRVLFSRDGFLRDNPDYLRSAEWRAGNHWLVTRGFVPPGEWTAATGLRPDEYAPAAVLDDAARETILRDLAKLLKAESSESELVHIAILNPDGSELAASAVPPFRIDPDSLMAAPFTGEAVRIGNTVVRVETISSDQAEPLVRAMARLYSDDGGNRLLGSTLVILRTARLAKQQRAFFLLMLGVTAVLAALMSVVCWYSVRRITSPMRRLAADMRAIAEGDYGRRAVVHQDDEMGMLAQTFNAMAERLRLARLNEQASTRLESDLAIARDIQKNLLPPQTPRVRGLDIHTAYRPAKEIGGDYFDFLPVDGEHMGLIVADASGKSIPAALVISTTRAILRFVALGSLSAAETLSRVNAILSADIPRGMFVTAYYLILDPRDNTMLCASAGHTPLLVARGDGSVEPVNPGGIALGFDGGPIFQRSIREQRTRLEQGDRVLAYTDGVVECVNAENEEYSDRRLREFLRRNRNLSSRDFVGALMADLDRHRGTADMRDDITIVTFKVL